MKRGWIFVMALLVLGNVSGAGEWKYRVRSPLMGVLGTIAIEKKEERGRYRIEAEARTEGIAATLTGKRREFYRSEGLVRDGRFLSRRFHLERKMKNKQQIDDYRIDAVHQSIVKRKIRWKDGRLDKNSSKTLKYFSEMDLAALYANAVPAMLQKPAASRKEYLSVGAEKVKGKVVVTHASEERSRKERERLKVDPGTRILIVSSPEKILGKKNRELILAVGPDGVLRKARLVAVPIVGEIFVERVNRR
jgi:hypothetical protein